MKKVKKSESNKSAKILSKQKEILKEEDSLLKVLHSRIGRLSAALERTRIDEYTSMLKRPWRLFFFNFLVGIFRGLGIAVGMTIIAAVVIYVLGKVLVKMVDLPIIGMYIAEIVKLVNEYSKGMPGR